MEGGSTLALTSGRGAVRRSGHEGRRAAGGVARGSGAAAQGRGPAVAVGVRGDGELRWRGIYRPARREGGGAAVVAAGELEDEL